jgi:DNA-binding response OmpR family regulator
MTNNVIRPTGEPAAARLQGQTSLPRRILVADDEAAIRRLITAALVGSGYHVDAAEDGAVAWDAIQAQPYDLLITDQNMPKITGLELVKNLRSARMALPVVMVTGILPTYELAQEPSLQLAATLLKPFAVSTLLDTVENVLRATDSPRPQINPLLNWRSQPSTDGLRF